MCIQGVFGVWYFSWFGDREGDPPFAQARSLPPPYTPWRGLCLGSSVCIALEGGHADIAMLKFKSAKIVDTLQYLEGFMSHCRWLFGISEPSTVSRNCLLQFLGHQGRCLEKMSCRGGWVGGIRRLTGYRRGSIVSGGKRGGGPERRERRKRSCVCVCVVFGGEGAIEVQ